MTRQARAAWLLGAALLAPSALSLHAQVVPAASQQPAPTAPSTAAAKAAFRNAIFETQNVGGDRAQKQLDAALAADPQFGLARIYQAFLSTGTSAEREARISATLGALNGASPAEALLAVFWREQAAGRGAAAVPIIKAAAELAPNDAEINYIYANTQRTGKSAAEQVAVLKSFLQRFPKHAAAYNTLAYILWRTGDRDGTLAAAQQYVQNAPEHPNAHDTFADILLLLGRGQEAIPHVQQIRRLDPTWPFAEAKLGAIALTMGDVKAARTHFSTGLTPATDPADRIDAAYWLVATDLVAKDTRAAVEQINRIADVAKSADVPGAVSLAYDRAAVLEAYVGNRSVVPARLSAASAAATNNNQKATYQAHAAIALSRLGQGEAARAALAEFTKLGGPADAVPALEALLALDAKDYGAAEAALAKAPSMDVLPRALRAELLMRTGKKAEGEALRKEVMNASLKQDGNPGVEFSALIGRTRLASL